jgi:hypothetical protein
MKRLERQVNLENGGVIIDVICSKIEGRTSGDWNEYDRYEEVRYVFDLDDEDEMCEFEDVNVSVEDIKEYVGEGVCYVDNEDFDVWYNISIKGNELYIDWLNIEI